MASSSSVTTVTAGLGFDADEDVTSIVGTMADQDYTFCLRYVSVTLEWGSSDLTTDEVDAILGAGLSLGVIQHSVTESVLTSALGTYNGGNAAANAKALGVPAGVTLWCSFESPMPGSDSLGYLQAWANAITANGYVPGLYVGLSPLTGSQLYSLPFQHYWKSGSIVPLVETRGYQMVQGKGFSVDGVSIDPDIACYDAEGDLFTVMTST